MLAVISESQEWKILEQHVETIRSLHLKDLIKNPERSAALVTEYAGITLDYSRQNVQPETLVSFIVVLG